MPPSGVAAAPTEPAALRIRDLGPLQVDVADTAGVPISGKPARILSALLMSPNRRVGVDALVTAVWGDEVTHRSAKTLETHVLRLRKTLEPSRRSGQPPTYLINESSGYRLIVNPGSVDSLRFAQLAEQGTGLLVAGEHARALERFDAALRMWRGQPFELVADEQWAAPLVARLSELHLDVQEQRVHALVRAGQTSQAVIVLEELVAQTPLREGLWAQLMLARHRAGHTEEALEAYQRVRRVLADELGVEPGQPLRDLHHRVLNRDPALNLTPDAAASARERPRATASGPRLLHLPEGLPPLIGREVEMSRLGRLMRRAQLLTVVGPAGCGKTRFAVEVAQRNADDVGADGVWFVDLSAVKDSARVADVVAATVGLAAPAVGGAVSALRAYLRDRQVLLVLDNCEHLLPGVAALATALLDGDCGTLLATSREPLRVDGELVWPLGPLAVRDRSGGQTNVDTLPSPAAHLFVARIRDNHPRFRLSGDSLDLIEAVCADVDGLPLAIELVAGNIVNLETDLPKIREQLAHGLLDLGRSAHSGGTVDHHRTIDHAIDWGVRLLRADERTAHARLSVLPGVFTAEAATAVVGHGRIRPTLVADLLARLVSTSLLAVVRPTEPDMPTRYRQLVTVRAHATRALIVLNETTSTIDRRAAYIRALVAACPDLHRSDAHGAYARLDHDHDTLTAELQRTLIDQPQAFGSWIMARITAYWAFRSRLLEVDHWAWPALALTGADTVDQNVIRLGLAGSLALRDRVDLAAPLVRAALKMREQVDLLRMVHVLTSTAWSAFIREDRGLDFVEKEVVRLAAGAGSEIAFYPELLAVRALFVADGSAAAGPRANRLLDRAAAVGNTWVAWKAGWLSAVCAVLNEEPAWAADLLDRTADCQRALGLTFDADVIEFRADLAVLTGQVDRAAALYSQARAKAFASGTPWPFIPLTRSIMQRAQASLTPDHFEQAWRDGTQAIAAM